MQDTNILGSMATSWWFQICFIFIPTWGLKPPTSICCCRTRRSKRPSRSIRRTGIFFQLNCPTWVRKKTSTKLTLVATCFFGFQNLAIVTIFRYFVLSLPHKKATVSPKKWNFRPAVFGSLHTRYSHCLHTGIIRLLLTPLLNQKFQVPKMQLLSLFWGCFFWDSASPFFRVLPEAGAHFAEASWRESQGKGGVENLEKVTPRKN